MDKQSLATMAGGITADKSVYKESCQPIDYSAIAAPAPIAAPVAVAPLAPVYRQGPSTTIQVPGNYQTCVRRCL